MDPKVLLAEHPNATLAPGGSVQGFGADLKRIVRGRGMAALVLTADQDFARARRRRGPRARTRDRHTEIVIRLAPLVLVDSGLLGGGSDGAATWIDPAPRGRATDARLSLR